MKLSPRAFVQNPARRARLGCAYLFQPGRFGSFRAGKTVLNKRPARFRGRIRARQRAAHKFMFQRVALAGILRMPRGVITQCRAMQSLVFPKQGRVVVRALRDGTRVGNFNIKPQRFENARAWRGGGGDKMCPAQRREMRHHAPHRLGRANRTKACVRAHVE